MIPKKILNKYLQFAINNYFILIFILAIGFVGIVSVYKLFFTKPTYIYAKIKVGQGLWWANTQKPSMWFIEAIKKANDEKDLAGKPIAKIMKVTYYPWWGSGQYDVYVEVKLKVSKVGKAGKYNFKRTTIGVGAPIDFEFDTVQFSGTVINLYEKEQKEIYTEKLVTITKKNAYPWEYDAIMAGDKFFNGETETLQVVNKQAIDTLSLSDDLYGNLPAISNDNRKYISVQLRLKGKAADNQFVYAEEQPIVPGKGINIGTSNFIFTDFVVAKIE
ncbi:MAG: hypothetical protein WC489_05375 [Patescibacteria group bacterium]